MERMHRLRASIAPVDSAERYSKQLGVEFLMGWHVFSGGSRIELNGKSLKFAKAVVATGGTAAILNIPGPREASYITNATVINLTVPP
jgi:pyruvate/2-oxoglutarate dehydrogenase complex dihydrolipoamide dehydrogenase (E3) component